MAKISKTVMDKMIKANAPEAKIVKIDIGDEKVAEIEVRSALSLSEWRSAVREMVELQFTTGEDGMEVYLPELAEFAEWYVRLKYLTNIDVDLKPDENGVPDGKCVERIWALYNFVELRIAVYDACPSLDWAAQPLVEQRRDTLSAVKLQFWVSLKQIVDAVQEDFGVINASDLADMAEAVQKLKGLDQGKIVELMQEHDQDQDQK
jgi:hypothetical protein